MKKRTPVDLHGVNHWFCQKCKSYQPEFNFFKSKTPNGLSYYCKPCHIDVSRTTSDPEKVRIQRRLSSRRDRIRHRDKRNKAALERSLKNSNNYRVKQRKEFVKAVQRGDMIRPNECSMCGDTGKICGHHDDYSKPFEVRWVCYSCHGKIHRKAA